MYSNQLLDITVHFSCRTNHKYKNGLNPIVLSISYRGGKFLLH